MARALQFAGLLILASAVLAFGDQKADAKAPTPKSLVRPIIPKKAGGGRAMGPRLTNPGSPASRLFRAGPEERERALEKLPPRQQEQIRKNLAWFDGLPKADQTTILKRAERYEALSPEARQTFNQQFRAWQQLPQDRRQAVAAALRRLQTLSDDQRNAVLSSAPFRERFSSEEQKLIADLSQLMPPM